jgi:outer membrane protein OmpA-like peptidoglycan-associated protein
LDVKIVTLKTIFIFKIRKIISFYFCVSMRYIKFVIILFSLVFTNSTLFAQEQFTSCVNPNKIEISSILNSDQVDEIHYQPEDKYTYWYELYSEEAESLQYEMTPINAEDNYELLIYKKKGNNVCNDLVHNNLKPFLNKVKGELRFDKGDIYYLNVIYISGNGCGHSLELKTSKGILKIKAIQNDCVEEVMEEILKVEVEVEVEIEEQDLEVLVSNIELKEEIIITPKEIDANVQCLVINNKTEQSVEALVSVKGVNNDLDQNFIALIDSGFMIENYLDSLLFVSVKKLGYKVFKDTVKLDSGRVTIKLNPIEVGEKLVMRKVYFHPNTYVLKEESKEELNKLLSFILENKKNVFEIQGHTNGNRMVKRSKRYSHLGEDWNFKGSSKKLSKLRAEKIKTYLMKNGVPETQLQTKGYGGDREVVSKPKNMIQAMKNIRVEVIVLQ